MGGHPQELPHEGAVWRTYYESLKAALTLFAAGNIGVERLSYHLNEQGYPFCDRKGQPRRWCRDDVRRVLANWPEYGGLVFDQPAKDRPVSTRDEVDNIHLDPERAVLPVELLKKVAYTRADRTLLAVDRGAKTEAYPYPLSHLTRCAHCEKLVQQENDPRLRTQLGGTMRASGRVYRHKTGVKCGCLVRSVLCEQLEEDFGTLIKGLMVNEAAFVSMITLANEVPDTLPDTEVDTVDMAQHRQRAILKLKKKLDNLKTLFREADIEEEEYRTRLAELRAELAYWEAYQTETEQVVLQLSLCLEAIGKVARLWDIAEAQERRSMAQNLFDYIVYDLDKQRIVDFRLKPWANRFLVVRATWDLEGKKQNTVSHGETTQELRRNMPHTGVKPISRPQIKSAVFDLLDYFFGALSARQTSKTALAARNGHIMGRFAAGETIDELAKAFGLTYQRVYQIIRSQ